VETQFPQVMAFVMLWLEIKMFESSALLGAGMATRVSVLGSIVKFKRGGRINYCDW